MLSLCARGPAHRRWTVAFSVTGGATVCGTVRSVTENPGWGALAAGLPVAAGAGGANSASAASVVRRRNPQWPAHVSIGNWDFGRTGEAQFFTQKEYTCVL